ncbi:MAG: hypothetical protein ACI4JN_06040, partial [Ruminococcus sp.]
ILALVIFIIVTARRFALSKRKREFNDNNTISAILKIYQFLMTLLKYQSILPENMQLLDFAENVKQQLNELGYDGDGASGIIKAALAADMGGIAPSRQEIRSYIAYVDSLALSFGSNKNIFIYLLLKYFYHFF